MQLENQEVMKKNYNQPIVETARLEITGQTLCASPGAGISGGSGSGTTGDIGGGSSPIPGE